MTDYTPALNNYSAMRKFGNNRWILYSVKAGRKIILFSNLEYYNYLFSEFDPSIVFLCEQAPKISVELDDGVKKSIFDLVTIDEFGNEIFVECKYSKDLTKPKVKKQLQAQRFWCKKNGYNHKLFTEESLLGREIEISNLMQFHSIIQSEKIDESTIEIITQLLKDESKTIKVIANFVQMPLEKMVLLQSFPKNLF